MKKTVFAVTILIGFWSIPQDGRAAFPLPYTNTVALWLFDEGTGTNFNDAVNNNTGHYTLSFDPTFSTTTKKFGGSSMQVSPSFSDDQGLVADSSSLHVLTNTFSVEGWWMSTNAVVGAHFPTLISRADSGGGPNLTQWAMGLSGSFRLVLQVFDATTATSLVFTDPNPFPSNQFVHVAFTFNAGALNLYENGSLIGGVTNASVRPSGVGRVLLGDYANAGGLNADQHPWRGFIDEVRLSDIARIAGDGSGTNNFLAFNTSLVPEPTAVSLGLLGLAWVMLPVVRRLRR